MVDFHFLKILLSVVFYFSLLFENSPVNFAVASLRAAKSSSSAVRFFCHSFHQSDHNSPTCNLLCIHTQLGVHQSLFTLEQHGCCRQFTFLRSLCFLLELQTHTCLFITSINSKLFSLFSILLLLHYLVYCFMTHLWDNSSFSFV